MLRLQTIICFSLERLIVRYDVLLIRSGHRVCGHRCRRRYRAAATTRLTLTKRFTNHKVNLKHLGLYMGTKMQLVSYEFEYFYQCIMTFGGLRDSKGPTVAINDLLCMKNAGAHIAK